MRKEWHNVSGDISGEMREETSSAIDIRKNKGQLSIFHFYVVRRNVKIQTNGQTGEPGHSRHELGAP